MSDVAIRVENLSKKYKIGIRRHDSLKDLLTLASTAYSALPASGLRSPVVGWSAGRSSRSAIPHRHSDI
jgi:hypothetical protein